ncbi:MAG TPA: amidase [Novosphingobium sp.]|nr:amidase [Novosphingobium sp.]
MPSQSPEKIASPDQMSAAAALDAALARIGLRDRDVRAWTSLDPAGARAQAAQAQGPLAGLVLGVKDVIDARGLPTLNNSPLGNMAPAIADAPCVAVLRQTGAVVLGKTDTTEFAAAGRNAATANPHALNRTPGGSSSGSAAAVADGHVPIALATQTGGSTIRPASFCGIPALKPTWGAISREGAKIYANSLDTIGLYASDLALIDRMAQVFDFAAPRAVPSRPRIGLCRTPYWAQAEDETRTAMADAAARLSAAGAEVVEISLPPIFDGMADAFMAILFREGAAAFLDLARREPALLHPDFHARVVSRETYPDDVLRAAYDATAQARMVAESLLDQVDAFLAPSAPGIAPVGRGPGNPIFNQMWTQLHLPVVNLPLYRAQENMPLGLSLIGRRYEDRRLLALAMQLGEQLGYHRPLA